MLFAWTVGDGMHLMIDFNQSLDMAEALRRCHMLDDLGLTWLEEPVVYDNFDGYAQLARELKTPLQIGENFYGTARPAQGIACAGLRSGDAGFHAHRRRHRMDARGRHRRRGRYPDVDAPLSPSSAPT